jgi:hypothetical protein
MENRRSALRAALLLLPEEFADEDLFVKIAGLSYMGKNRAGLINHLKTLLVLIII